jgi:hypothetical protein
LIFERCIHALTHYSHYLCYICVLILLYMCPHTTIYVSSYSYICVRLARPRSLTTPTMSSTSSRSFRSRPARSVTTSAASNAKGTLRDSRMVSVLHLHAHSIKGGCSLFPKTKAHRRKFKRKSRRKHRVDCFLSYHGLWCRLALTEM